MDKQIQLPSIADLPAHVLEMIAKFNARPMRRATDMRVLGWELIEVGR